MRMLSEERLAEIRRLEKEYHEICYEQQIEQGTRAGGGVCLILNTAAREQDVRTGKALAPSIELNLETEEMLNRLKTIFAGWNLHAASAKPLSFQIERDGKAVQLDSESLTFLVFKNKIII